MEHPPGLHYLLSEGAGGGQRGRGGLWRRVLRGPISARLGRRTAHVYRQHSAGRGCARRDTTPGLAFQPQRSGVTTPVLFLPMSASCGDILRHKPPRSETTRRISVRCSAYKRFHRWKSAILSNRVRTSSQLLGYSSVRVFLLAVELAGSSGENKQVDRRKIGSRSDVDANESSVLIQSLSICRCFY